MPLNSIPTEQTTAITDALLALLALAAAGYVWRFRTRDAVKVGIWTGVMSALAAAAALGAVAHGFVLTDRLNGMLWSGIYLALGACVACFVAAAVYDLRGRKPAVKTLFIALAVALLVFIATKLLDDSFVPFIVFEGMAMMTALGIYGHLALFSRIPGMKAITLGVALTLLAALLQGLGWGSFHLIWSFNHNGTYHLIQIVGLVVLMWGWREALDR